MFMNLYDDASTAQSDTIAAINWTAMRPMGDQNPGGKAAAGLTPGADLTFTLTDKPQASALASAQANVPNAGFLRLDEVWFPVGAVAHLHTHTGSGFRWLARGSLRIEGADAHTVMDHGHHWFEPAQTPVRAVALQTEGVTSFVRAMVIPASFEGQSTFQLCNPDDAALPRLQVTHRHLDVPIPR